MARVDPQIPAHLEWMGFVQPKGLVVSAPALVRAGVILHRSDAEGQQLLRASVVQRAFEPKEGPVPCVADFRAFASAVLGWSFSPRAYAGTPENPIPPELAAPVPGHDEVLRPDFAVSEPEPSNGASPWQLIVQVLPAGEDLDCVVRSGSGLDASPHGRMERLLRHTNVPAGVLFNGRVLRLVSAPRGESSGWLDFRVADMVETTGRPIATAMRKLLSEQRLLSMARSQRLAALLADSRKYQNEVSEQLAMQVLHALYELLRGFQSAHDVSRGVLLREALDDHPDEIYRGLLTVILRLVFLLYAEERDLLPKDEAFVRYYSLAGLYERLRADAALYPDTMDQRFGAWAQLLVLFRMLHDGAESGPMKLPRRHGILFDPNRFPFLEGRPMSGGRQIHERVEPPPVPDGTIHRALEKLLVLEGERISYRALDVEEIGSVYQAMMGFRLETATGRSIAVKAQKKWSAPTAVSLEALLAVKPVERKKWLEEQAARKVPDGVARAMKEATNLEDLHAALTPVVDRDATPDLVPEGSMVLQPSEERRRSGSHYTPRSLTEPIVRTTLEPCLTRLRGPEEKPPTPEQILDLKICDPAMGSGAFLVEACRQLGEALVESWHAHEMVPAIPADEDERIHARRLVAQRCIYGVDRNPMAVDLAKVSLWLATLAKDHPLTFLDHALRHGDSLVGLSRKQIEAFHWDANAPEFQAGIETVRVREHLKKISELRARIRAAGDETSDVELAALWEVVQRETAEVRFLGDLAVAAFFDCENARERAAKRAEYANAIVNGTAEELREDLQQRRHADPPLVPFHWELEFPEVFEREFPGFDAFVGNPPFMGGSRISTVTSKAYAAYLGQAFPEARGKSDLVAYFFRRAFELCRECGTFGLVATNTIRQGATRYTGLRWIRLHDGYIYSAVRRLRWPGAAAVIVSVVHVFRGPVAVPLPSRLDGKPVNRITAYLYPAGPDEDPATLRSNASLAFSGVNPNGKGFVLTREEKESLVARDRASVVKIVPYLGSVEMNESPDAAPSRYIIDFGECDEGGARSFPALFDHLYGTVRIQRRSSNEKRLRDRWWCFSRPAEDLRAALRSVTRALVSGRVATYHTFTFQPPTVVFSDAVTVFLLDSFAGFAALQAQPHEWWAGFQGSSFKDDPRYIPEDCFETFPLPRGWRESELLERAGEAFYRYRADLMFGRAEGLTATYTRFHDPDERDPGILKLRDLHAAMDRAVLDAYGWGDVPTDCEFLLDYEIDEEEWGDRKKPWRYRWPDEVRDEVLARLLELNAERAREEARAGTAGEQPKAKPGKGRKGKKDTLTGDLI